jgi:hypothetical protein
MYVQPTYITKDATSGSQQTKWSLVVTLSERLAQCTTTIGFGRTRGLNKYWLAFCVGNLISGRLTGRAFKLQREDWGFYLILFIWIFCEEGWVSAERLLAHDRSKVFHIWAVVVT